MLYRIDDTKWWKTTLCTIHFAPNVQSFIKRKFKRKLRNEIKWTNGDKHLQKPTHKVGEWESERVSENDGMENEMSENDAGMKRWQSRAYSCCNSRQAWISLPQNASKFLVFCAILRRFRFSLSSFWVSTFAHPLARSLNHPVYFMLLQCTMFKLIFASAHWWYSKLEILLQCKPRERDRLCTLFKVFAHAEHSGK